MCSTESVILCCSVMFCHHVLFPYFITMFFKHILSSCSLITFCHHEWIQTYIICQRADQGSFYVFSRFSALVKSSVDHVSCPADRSCLCLHRILTDIYQPPPQEDRVSRAISSSPSCGGVKWVLTAAPPSGQTKWSTRGQSGSDDMGVGRVGNFCLLLADK